ncbi:MAG: alpha/beta hydrolase [Dehalococcoidia bacterium]|nr:alpha/beta hydrolase [Dehalococcoidia bacterium]MDW8119078.1 alpha/beta hydrolase [Chloroflexota bacterium]
MEPAERWVTANGLRVHLLEWGRGPSTALLVHATGFCALTWAPVAEVLAQHRWRVLAPDLRGHGLTEKAVGPDLRWSLLAQDLACLMDVLDLRDAFLVGHSRGGGVVLLAGPWIGHRVRAMVLVEPSAIMRGNASQVNTFLAAQARQRRAVFGSLAEAFAHYKGRGAFRRWPDASLWLYLKGGFAPQADGSVALLCTPDTEARFYEAVMDVDKDMAFHSIRWPVLVVRGTESDRFRFDMPAFQHFLQQVHGPVRTAEIPGADHFVPMEQPEVLARLILDFFKEVGAPV